MNDVVLSAKEIAEVKKLAKETRMSFGVHDEVPIANDMRMLINRQGIILCEYPFGEDSKIDAEIVRFEADSKPLIFIGLNSSLYFDEQIFALAHEIYHYKTKTGNAFDTDEDDNDDRLEKKADRFAAELLLPESVLRSAVVFEFANDLVDGSNILRVLRFIATLQIIWWLPYKSIVIRLLEENLIDHELHDRLLREYDSRKNDNEYCKIMRAIDSSVADMLNKRTNKTSVSNMVIDTVLKNYDDEYISEDEFVDIMNTLHIDPSDYGYELGGWDASEE